jgi:hypothetical protein
MSQCVKYIVVSLLVWVTSSVFASPPPPPPSYVSEATSALVDANDIQDLDRFLAADVHAYQQGKLVAAGKAKAMELLSGAVRHKHRVEAYSDGNDLKGGSILIVDSYDPSDAAPPAYSVVDPRLVSRATLYVFGQDHLIHNVQILEATGFWVRK